MTWDAVVKLWYDEEKDFVYGGNANDYMKVGHYTQVSLRWQNAIIRAFYRSQDLAGKFIIILYNTKLTCNYFDRRHY